MNPQKKHIEQESFRDHIATIDKAGKRNWIFAQRPSGRLYNLRSWLSVFYLIVFFGLPFVKINGNPFLMLNVLERQFILFGITFWPQDFFIFGIGMLTFIVFIVLFTVVFGRVFCGWACPQTIFMEMVFRRIEYWIEGDAAHQRALKAAPISWEKGVKKGGKHLAFFALSFFISNTFLTYIIGIDELRKIISEPISLHWGGLTALLLFTGVFYAVYSWFREQVCLIVCPYGRLQGVMTDRNSILVAYDYLRGEPRGKFKKVGVENQGDCIDCGLCVKVCPTGIDIRNGTQLECTNCTACIDVCDGIMEKIHRPSGLIRYASENNIAKGEQIRLTGRIVAYSAVLLLLLGVLSALLLTRKNIDTTILRTPGMLFQHQGNDSISNLYNVKIINKTHEAAALRLELEDVPGTIQLIGKSLVAKASAKSESEFFIVLPEKSITNRKTKVKIGVYQGDEKIETITTSFLGPRERK